ncbi:MAG: type III-A CRISPR-associated protein Cas10/Csm1, partial [Anaerovoracaceae bacterium]
NSSAKDVAIVYSGGDDVFLIGAWNEVIEAAQDLQRSFSKFTENSLTISAGIGIFGASYPVSKMAAETELLEQASKSGNKNQITLFEVPIKDKDGNIQVSTNHTYRWDTFRDKVIGEKYAVLEEFFAHEENERGKAYLYQLLNYLREIENDRINLARYAYLLARLEPKKTSNFYDEYVCFSQKMYRWINNEEDRRQLITGIYIYVYQKREE